MNLSKLIFTALSGSAMVITILIGSWMSHVNSEQQLFDQRLATSEAHYAVLESNIQDLRQHIDELKQTIITQSRGK